MKQIYLLLYVLMSSLLMVSCSRKETFYFSKDTGSFGAYRNSSKAKILPDSAAILSSQLASVKADRADSLLITAATGPGSLTLSTPLKKEAIPPILISALPQKKLETKLTQAPTRSINPSKSNKKK